MHALTQELIRLLTALDYNGDKNEFVNTFLDISHKQTIMNLVSTLSPETAQEFEKDLSAKKYASIEECLNAYFTPDQMKEAFKLVMKKNLQEALEAAVPSLSESQLAKVKTFVSGNAVA